MPSKIVPCLWFDHQAEEAARFYTSVFKDGKIHAITRYPNAGKETHGRDAGSVMTVEFELNGQAFTALNGGPHFKFNEAVSFQVMCATQEEIDHYWEKLGAGGDPSAQQCGWLKDRFGPLVADRSRADGGDDDRAGRSQTHARLHGHAGDEEDGPRRPREGVRGEVAATGARRRLHGSRVPDSSLRRRADREATTARAIRSAPVHVPAP